MVIFEGAAAAVAPVVVPSSVFTSMTLVSSALAAGAGSTAGGSGAPSARGSAWRCTAVSSDAADSSMAAPPRWAASIEGSMVQSHPDLIDAERSLASDRPSFRCTAVAPPVPRRLVLVTLPGAIRRSADSPLCPCRDDCGLLSLFNSHLLVAREIVTTWRRSSSAMRLPFLQRQNSSMHEIAGTEMRPSPALPCTVHLSPDHPLDGRDAAMIAAG